MQRLDVYRRAVDFLSLSAEVSAEAAWVLFHLLVPAGQVEHAGEGSYTVRLTVEDADGLPAYDLATVDLWPDGARGPRVVISAIPTVGDAPLTILFDADVTVAESAVVVYAWKFSDESDRTFFEPIPVRTYNRPGYREVSLKVTDDNGRSANDTLTFFVTQDGQRPPRIVSIPSATARVGVPYVYDRDGAPTAQGDRPLVWRLGRVLNQEVVDAPDGMSIDTITGTLSWIPQSSQVGNVRVALVAENPAGADLQLFQIRVEDATGAAAADTTGSVARASGCGCTSSGAGPSAGAGMWLWMLWLGVSRSGRRRCG